MTPSTPAALDRATLEKKIDELVNAHMAVNGFSGSVLLAHEGKPLVAKGYGFANAEWQIPNAPNTKFRIGSITKAASTGSPPISSVCRPVRDRGAEFEPER